MKINTEIRKIILEILKEEFPENEILDLSENIIFGDYQQTIKSEGLIRTESINKTIQILKRKFNLSDKEIFINDNKINLTINSLNKKSFIKNFKEFNTWIQNLGWFVGTIKYLKNNKIIPTIENRVDIDHILYLIKDINIYLLDIEYNALFDIEVKNRVDKVFHISLTVNRNKILKNGLVPKTKNKLFNYPERIYLIKDLNIAKQLGKRLKKYITNKTFERINKNGEIEFDIYEINLKTPYDITIYEDPNFKEKGLFTMDNINPENLKIIETFSV